MRPVVEELVPAPDPVVCCERLAGLPYRLFLDSAARGSRLGRYSFLTADPVTVVHSRGAVTQRLDVQDGVSRVVDGDALTVVRNLLAPFAAEAVRGLPPFQGGAAGYLAYDWGRVLERLPAPPYDDLALPDVVIGVYDWVLAWDHDTSRAWLISTGIPGASAAARAGRARDRAAEVRDLITAERRPEGLRLPLPPGPLPAQTSDAARSPRARVGEDLQEARVGGDLQVSVPRQPGSAPSYPIEDVEGYRRLGLRSSFTHAGYLDAVRRVREYIYAGDIFQANLSQRFEVPLGETPWDLYRRMRVRNAAPFAAYFDCPDAAIVSASPERFLRVDEDGGVETRPIKGTRPRGVGPEHDGALGQALTESAKDRAENLMIVDLMRNDLSRVCEPGTVRVPELFTLERYATVHHLVSTVVGRLAEGRDVFDLVRATFPGGSITGAPKLRAMEIIAELEPSQRSVYCGSLGYWSVTGAMDTNIAIRTAIVTNDRVYFSAGGGIVADSDPEQEYRETLDKARGMIEALDRDRRHGVRLA